jgi:hypothetical protein
MDDAMLTGEPKPGSGRGYGHAFGQRDDQCAVVEALETQGVNTICYKLYSFICIFCGG